MSGIDRRKHDIDVVERVLNSAREDDAYESDRRGEHRYPDTDEQTDRLSHREREEFRARLERQS